jgi:opacity protein-like surface antigen
MKHITILTTLTLAATLGATPALAYTGNYLGPALNFGLGRNTDTTFGLESKLAITPDWSLRPSVFFGNGGTQFNGVVTYNLDIFNNSYFTPFVGGGIAHYSNNNSSTTSPLVALGLDYEFNPDWVLLTKVNVPLSNNLNSSLTIGAGYRF